MLSGGASDSTAGGITLRATLGQPVVGVISGGDVALGQGFWHGGAAGGIQQVVVTVTVPAGAAGGVVESTVITATSQAAPTIFDAVTDTTTVEEYRLYLPLILCDH